MNFNKSMEMYLETIYILEDKHGHAHVVDIADELGITKPSVTKAMDKLKRKGLIHKESYGHITLTEKGEEFAKRFTISTVLLLNFWKKLWGSVQVKHQKMHVEWNMLLPMKCWKQ